MTADIIPHRFDYPRVIHRCRSAFDIQRKNRKSTGMLKKAGTQGHREQPRASGLEKAGENANITASIRFIWGMSVEFNILICEENFFHNEQRLKEIIMKIIKTACLFIALTLPTNTIQAQSAPTKVTTVTEDNYDRAENQGVVESYLKKIAAATNTDGLGVFWHVRKGADPKDKTIPRINFDTIYSWAVVDLTEDLTLTMPETSGRYQSAWIVDEEHYNPMAFNEAGEHKLTKANVGSRYAMIVMRTQVNTRDPEDLAKANKIQDQLTLTQKDKGSYVPSYKWDHDEVKKMRAHFEQVAKDKGITSEVMFGKKGERTDEQHNAGTAVGWGGFTPEQAVYPLYYPTSTKHQTLTLKDVPTDNFWSVTVYDKGGFVVTDTYNINSQFAVAEKDGSVVINFGGDKEANNFMETFEGWTATLRIYRPKKAYFDGGWTPPKLVIAN